MAASTRTVERIRSVQTGKIRDIPTKALASFIAQQRTVVKDGQLDGFADAWQHVETRTTDLDSGEVTVVPAGSAGRPAVNAPKADWEAYASTGGVDTDGLSKAELIDAVEQADA